VWVGVTNDPIQPARSPLDSVSSLGDINTRSTAAPRLNPDRPTPDGNLVRTARMGDVTVSVSQQHRLAQLANGYANTTSTACNTVSHLFRRVRFRLRSPAAG